MADQLRGAPTSPQATTCRPRSLAQKSCIYPDETTELHGSTSTEYILSGPLISACDITTEAVTNNLSDWLHYGKEAARNLGYGSIDTLDDIQKLRIFRYYLPVFFWCQRQLKQHRAVAGAHGTPPPLVIGISAPQGSGKSTLVEQLEVLFRSAGSTAVGVSIDDFYLTFQDQQNLKSQHEGNKLFEVRGNAGTHDLALGSATLRALRSSIQTDGSSFGIPRYDKSAHEGRGDRADADTWPQVQGRVDLVLFEGWMLGFRPLPAADVVAVDPDLEPVNEILRDYETAWDSHVDVWLVIRVPDPNCVYKWRLQAEVAMRAKGKPGMTDEQVAAFVDRYMPAYRAYLKGLYEKGPTTGQQGLVLNIDIDPNRAPVGAQIM